MHRGIFYFSRQCSGKSSEKGLDSYCRKCTCPLSVAEKTEYASHLNLEALQAPIPFVPETTCGKSTKYILPRCSFYFHYKSIFYNVPSKNCLQN